MKSYSLSQFSDRDVDRGLATTVETDRMTTARLLAYLGESDARKRYLPAGYSSMYDYCVGSFRMSEDVAHKRIRVARAARRFPGIFDSIAEGRLGLTSVLMLVPHLVDESAGALLAAAEHKTNTEIEILLAERFPRPDLPTLVHELSAPAAAASDEVAVRPPVPSSGPELAYGMEPLSPRPRLTPRSPGRFAVQVTLNQDEYDDLERAQELLAHVLPTGDAARVIGRALRELVAMLEKRKFARTDKPRAPRGTSSIAPAIPAHVRRMVAERDGGRCTFVGENGRRCEARRALEFDHVLPVARGGESTVEGVRLRCRAHNQYEAERVFGAEFMQAKREAARRRKEQARAEATSAAEAAANVAAARRAAVEEVTPWLRALGLNLAEARRAAAPCADMPNAPLEERVRAAVRTLGPHGTRRVLPVPGAPPSLPGSNDRRSGPACPSPS